VPGRPPPPFPRLRLADTGIGVQEVWKLYGQGSVGSQALLGIPRVHWLRDHPTLRACSRVWPFETGFTPRPTPPRGPSVLHAEIWPGIVARADFAQAMAKPDVVKDQAQVRLLCQWARALDTAGQLHAYFDTPSALAPIILRRVADEEGWILGRQF
jgi:hypothetical protein